VCRSDGAGGRAQASSRSLADPPRAARVPSIESTRIQGSASRGVRRFTGKGDGVKLGVWGSGLGVYGFKLMGSECIGYEVQGLGFLGNVTDIRAWV
jgi:purine-nucleoside phosphorylase